MADSRDRGKMVHPKHGAPAGGYQPAPAPHQTCPMDHARDDVLTPAAIERIKAEVMTLETIGGLWVSAEAAAQQPVVVGASPRGRTPAAAG
ncbi:MAG: hypothetical protein IPM60_15060 [Rhodospirillales bacterium]|nr:hypothetical protein [Rhodospirillales bacterium]